AQPDSMKKLLLGTSILALLAACTTVPVEEATAPPAGEAAVDISAQPLRVPALSALPETPLRPLQGRFARADWASLPGWSADDLHHVWKGFINNCKGLMRPVSGSLALPARAAPRAWQPVCQAAAAQGL